MKEEAAAGLSWRCDALSPDLAHALEEAWADLATHAVEPNVFSFPWFVIPSLPLLAPLDPALVTIRQEGRLIGLFLVRADFGYAKLPISFLRTALHLGQYLGTPLVRAGHEALFAQGLLAWLDAAPAHQAFLKLTLLTEGGPVAEAIAARCEAERRPFMAINPFARAAIDLRRADRAGDERHLGAGRRKSLRRAMRGLAAQGPVAIARLEDRAALDDWLTDFLRLEHGGWKGAQGTSILSIPQEESFYRQMAAAAFRLGQLNLFRMSVAGRPVAYTLDVTAASHIYCLKTAFDHGERRHGPGVLMEYEALGHYSRQPGIRFVDSCTAAGNALLNELWPDRQPIVDLAIGRSGAGYGALFRLVRHLKRTTGIGAEHGNAG